MTLDLSATTVGQVETIPRCFAPRTGGGEAKILSISGTHIELQYTGAGQRRVKSGRFSLPWSDRIRWPRVPGDAAAEAAPGAAQQAEGGAARRRERKLADAVSRLRAQP